MGVGRGLAGAVVAHAVPGSAFLPVSPAGQDNDNRTRHAAECSRSRDLPSGVPLADGFAVIHAVAHSSSSTTAAGGWVPCGTDPPRKLRARCVCAPLVGCWCPSRGSGTRASSQGGDAAFEFDWPPALTTLWARPNAESRRRGAGGAAITGCRPPMCRACMFPRAAGFVRDRDEPEAEPESGADDE